MAANAKILCAVDFSPGSRQVVGKALELARGYGAALELLHVYQIPVLSLPDGAVSASPSYITELTSRAQRELEKLGAEPKASGTPITLRLLAGEAAQAIVDHAQREGFSLIVVGTHGRGGFQRFVLGSTAERVLRSASMPVLTVHIAG